ncbi:unnamed protein product, partial [Ascophyllum nodosum]
PSSAEAKGPASTRPPPSKKSPPPPRVGSSPVSPPPEDEKKTPAATADLASPRPLQAQAGDSAENYTAQPSPLRAEGPIAPSAEGIEDGSGRDQPKMRKSIGGEREAAAGEGWRTHPPAPKISLKSPPPSPKVPPGFPPGMSPPTSPPVAKSLATNKPSVNDKFETDEEEGQSDAVSTTELLSTPPQVRASPGQSPQGSPTSARQSPPGRRPPEGAPPGKRSLPSSPFAARPSPPPPEETSVLPSKDQEEIVVGDEKAILRPPKGLPLRQSLSSSEDDGDDESAGDEMGNPAGVQPTAHEGKELEFVRPGRLTVRCIAGADVHRSTVPSERTTVVDAYLKITLGKHERAPARRSQVAKRSRASPNFGSEKIAFDIVEPSEFIVKGDITLAIELWDGNARGDDLLASVQVSALRFMHPDAVAREEWFTLETPPGRVKGLMKVLVEISFQPALVGMFVLTLCEGKDLGANNSFVGPNPYVVATLGETHRKRSSVVKGGGSTPVFGKEEILFWVDKQNWTSDLTVQVQSEDIGTDAELGAATMSVLQAMATPPDNLAEQKLELYLDGKRSGSLLVESAFLPAGKLTLVCKAGRGLRETSAGGRINPYVVFDSDGQAVSLSRRTQVDKEGGRDPRWGDTMEFDIVDQHILRMQCFSYDFLASDAFVGGAQCSLLPAFKRGTMDTWVQLTVSNGSDPPKQAGEIHCVFSFVGPPGVAYPQHQSSVNSFDELLRVNVQDYLKGTDEEDQDGRRAVGERAEATDVIDVGYDRDPLERSPEFTDDEIAAAFKFLDLDRNLRLGAAEIRHILICMGELITDEEVDMMISMVNADGDGQVTYDEFHRVAIDPDPSRPDFCTNPVKTEPKAASSVATQDTKERESKRLLLEDFVKENEIRANGLELAYEHFRSIAPVTPGVGGAPSSVEMDFDTWMTIFNVEATGQYRELFRLYITPQSLEEGDGRVDIREFLLGMANFVDWRPEQRAQFIFMLFDEDRSGYLSTASKEPRLHDELVQVLKGTHLTSAKTVAKKVQTIMRQANADASGRLSADEFLVAVKKFPNLVRIPARAP